MEPNDPYKATNGFSQPTVTSPSAPSNEPPNFEAMGRLYYDNEQLKLRVKELESEKSKGLNYKERYYEKCEKYDDLEKKFKLLEDENRLLKQQLEKGIPHSGFLYNYDVMDFNEDMDASDIERLMDICLSLADVPQARGYLIEDSKGVIPIYILLAEKGAFRKHGNSDKDTRNWGLAAFCRCWNDNVVTRITDEKRRIDLCCEYKKIESALNKEPWSGANSCSWRKLHDSYPHNNGRNSRKKAKLGRAINIKSRLEKLLEQIPALKAKKY